MGYGRFVGRVGALAVALGIGLAAPAVAAADPADETSVGGASADTAGTRAEGKDAGTSATESTDDSLSDDSSTPVDDAEVDGAELDDAELDDAEVDGAEVDGAELDDSRASEESDTADPSGSAGGSESDVESSQEADDGPAPAEVGASDAEGAEESPDTHSGEAASRSGADPVELTDTVDADDARSTDGDVRGTDDPYGAAVADRHSLPAAQADAEVDSELTDIPAATPAAVSFASADPTLAAATPETAALSTGLAGMVSKFLAVLGIGPSAASGGVPLPTFEFVTVVLGAIRREIDQLFSNDGPTAAPALTGQAGPGVVTAAITVTDPEDDRLADEAVQVPVAMALSANIAPLQTDSPIALASPMALAAPATLAAPMALTSPMTLPDSSTFRVATASAAAAASSGTMYQVTTSGPDIVEFDPTRDKLDLGDASVHNFIVVDTPEGVGFRSPWTGDTLIVQGVSLGQLTVDSFAPIINDHLRQDLSGALAWERGITPLPNTVYVRSHEAGQIDHVAFDAVTDVVDFRYYGSREQINMADSPEGVIISNAGTGQALILQGATKDELSAKNFVFHPAQVYEDRLHQQLGFVTLPDSQVLPQGVSIAGTDNWPIAAGNGAPPVGETGTTTVIGWRWGTDTVLDFDPAKDKLDFGWFQADNFDVTEQAGSTQIAIVNNSQTYKLNGVALNELQTNNIIALDNGTRTKWQNLIFNALPQVPSPRLSVDDAGGAEGDAGTSNMVFTVRLSEASDDAVTASYTTSNGSATAAGLDYAPTVGTVTFAPGETSKFVNVMVTGDAMVELDEQFTLSLSAPVNATIGDGIATGTIINDDVDVAPATPPAVSIADLAVVEGNGQHSHFMFVATLNKASTDPVTVNYATADGTAVAGSDYSAASGTIAFAPGVTSQLVHVDVHGDTVAESNETFTVTLSNPAGATIAGGTAIGTITDDDTVVTDPVLAGGINSGNVGDALWGEEHFAPYVDMAGWPVPDLVKVAQDYGVSLLTLGFLQAAPDGSAAWGGYPTLAPGSSDSQAQSIDASIAAFKAAGGDVMISLGGASGTSLAQSHVQRGLGAQALADSYAAVVDRYSLNRIDFDIEGAAVAEPASIALRSEAIALLQQVRPDLEVWYTLPVLPTGLTHDGLNVVDSALATGVKLDGVNVMAMDYGESAAPTSGLNAKTMGAYAILAAESTHGQLSSLFAQYGQDFGWNQVGVTPMIGVNDVLTEVFTVADAQTLEDFARAQGVGMLSMWSVTRDTPGTLGQASPTASGLSVPAGSFSNVWNDYGTINVMNVGDAGGGTGGGGGGGGTPVEGGTTTAIGWNWGANTVLDFDPAADKLDFGWFQPTNFEVTEQAGSTTIAIVNNNQTYTLNGVALNAMQTANIIALDTNTVAKWQTLINNAGPSAPTLPSVSIGDAVEAEGNSGTSDLGFTVSLSEASANPVSVGYATSNGTATAGSDFTAKSGTVTFTPGVTSQQVQIGLLGDTAVESNETFTIVLSSPSGATIADGTATGTITNDDAVTPAPQLPTVSIGDAAGAEGNSGTSNMGFTVSLSEASANPVSVGYATSNGTATAGSDFTAKSGTVTFTPGVTSQLVNVGILGDTTVESIETFTITLTNPSGATLAKTTATGTITNDDVAADPGPTDPGAASVSFAKSADWGSGFNGDVTVTNTGSQELSDWQVEFDFGGDISSIWNASIVSKTGNRYVVQGVAWNSDVAAGSSTSFGFTATAGNPTNFALAGAATPEAPDPEPATGTPVLSVANTSVDEGNSGTNHLVFNLSLSATSDDVVTVSYRTEDFTASAGTDYQATQGTLTFAAGETAKQVHVTVLGDTAFETNESMLLVLSGITGAQFNGADGVGLISNDDANPNGTADPEYRVVGYFTEWGIYQRGFDVADIPANLLTDINYAFADINDAGEVVLFDRFAAVEKSYPGDTWDQPVRGNFNQLAKLKEQNPDLNVLISIGGWTLSEDFSDVAATQQAREKFAASAVDFITTYGFDGIDLDWEYPVEGGEDDNVHRPEDAANYVLLVAEIRRQLEQLEVADGIDDKDYLLTIASPAGYDKIANFDLAGMAPYLDWFQVMAYDFYGAGWSNQTGHLAGLYANPDSAGPLYNTDYAVSLYLEQVDPSKIVLGAPLYGHSWKGVPDGGNGGLNGMGTGAGVGSYGDQYGNISYWQIVELLEEHPDLYQVYWDDQAKASYIYNAADGTLISYESPEALQYRLDYIKDLGLGGVMFWEIDDDVRDYAHPQSLLALAASELLGGQDQTA